MIIIIDTKLNTAIPKDKVNIKDFIEALQELIPTKWVKFSIGTIDHQDIESQTTSFSDSPSIKDMHVIVAPNGQNMYMCKKTADFICSKLLYLRSAVVKPADKNYKSSEENLKPHNTGLKLD